MNISVFRNSQLVEKISFKDDIINNGGKDITFFIGRSVSCHVVLDDQTVSREHAELCFSKGVWTLKKCAQFSNITINGLVVEDHLLKNGDIVSIGLFTVSIEMDEVAPAEQTENHVEEVDTDLDVESVSDGMTVTVAMRSDEVLGDEEEENEDIEASDSEDINIDEDSEEVSDLDDLDGDFASDSDDSDDEELSDDLDEDGLDDFNADENLDGEVDSSFDEYADETGDDDMDDDSTRVIQAFAEYILVIKGEYAPYDNYKIEQSETFIGRDPEKCQIILNDPEVSSVHAVIRKTKISCEIEDLQSGNGSLLNGIRINKDQLTNGDEVLIGSTSFTVRIASDFLKNEESRLMPVEENQSIEVEEIVEVDENFTDDGTDELLESSDKSLVGKFKRAWATPAGKKRIIAVGGILFVLLMLMDTEPSKKKLKKNPKQVEKMKKRKSKLDKLRPEDREFVDSTYLLSKELYERGKYGEAMFEIEKIFQVIDDYKNTQQIYELAKEGIKKLERIAKKERDEKQRKERILKVGKLIDQARIATKEKNVLLAEGLFGQILELDPENFDVTQLKLQIDAYKKEQERIAVEKAQKEAERNRQQILLDPGKRFYAKKEWFNAISRLEKFLRAKSLDDDLIQEAKEMLETANKNLSAVVDPLIGKARSLKEGQDLKGAYEHYNKVLSFNPAHMEALNEMAEIRERLEGRSKRIYREAIISESLSLFEDAKEKFQEVQQISPSDSSYYIKATERLKEYMD